MPGLLDPVRSRLVVVCTIAALALLPRPAHAWGSDVHRLVMDRAIALLPEPLRPLFERYRATLVERSIDPETWRTAGFDDEPPHHFLNVDAAAYGPYPFRELPRDYAAAVAKFGADEVRRNGTLPWRAEEYFGNLRRAFESFGRRPDELRRFNVLLFSATLSHYVSDAVQPFHGVTNYDGQLTQQTGLHDRFEVRLFTRYQNRLRFAPKSLPPVGNPREFVFDRLLEDTQLVPQVLAADLKAIGPRDTYDDAYYDAFFADVQPTLERRINESISAVAAMITGAWEAAGRPPAPADLPPATPERRRPAR